MLPKFCSNKAVRYFASGAAVTFSSSVISCCFAIYIEGAANRTLYRFFPHWYKDVKYAYGIPGKNRIQQRTNVEINPSFLLPSSESCLMKELIEEM